MHVSESCCQAYPSSGRYCAVIIWCRVQLIHFDHRCRNSYKEARTSILLQFIQMVTFRYGGITKTNPFFGESPLFHNFSHPDLDLVSFWCGCVNQMSYLSDISMNVPYASFLAMSLVGNLAMYGEACIWKMQPDFILADTPLWFVS